MSFFVFFYVDPDRIPREIEEAAKRGRVTLIGDTGPPRWSRWGLGEAIKRTMEWYRSFYAGEAGSALCEGDIKAFLGEA